ncbi:DUF2219 domain-containing protein [bacterium]|nr:MAG: DUF2219 domain-containing protein [bacterium]
MLRRVALCLFGVLLALPATAQVRDTWTGRLMFENDVLWVDDSDRHYSNGIRLEARGREGHIWSWIAGPGRWLTGAGRDTPQRMGLALGHNIYTPEDIKTEELVEDDRPYAAWLHGDISVVAREGRTRTEATLSLGVVGPAARGEEMQRWFHGIIDSPIPAGWDNQLSNEPAVLLVVQRGWGDLVPPRPAPLLGEQGLDWDLVPHADLALGNVFVHAAGGAVLRLGNDLGWDLGPRRIRPTAAGGDLACGRRGFVWSVLGGVTGRAVVRNIFLDGNTFTDSHSVEKNSFVGDAWYGLTLSWGGLRTSFIHTIRSPEFEGQRRPDHFGSITVAWSP